MKKIIFLLMVEAKTQIMLELNFFSPKLKNYDI